MVLLFESSREREKYPWFPAWAELEVLPPVQGWVRGPVPPIKTCHEADRTWAHPQEVPVNFQTWVRLIDDLKLTEKRENPLEITSQSSHFNSYTQQCWAWSDVLLKHQLLKPVVGPPLNCRKAQKTPSTCTVIPFFWEKNRGKKWHHHPTSLASLSSALSRSTVNMESQPREWEAVRRPFKVGIWVAKNPKSTGWSLFFSSQ